MARGDLVPCRLGRAVRTMWSVAHRIVILGAGTGGTLTANRLAAVRTRSDEVDDHRRRPGRPARLPAGPAVRAVRLGARRRHRAAPRPAAARGHRLPPERRSTASTWTPTPCSSPTGPSSPTTCWSSPPARRCCPRRPRGSSGRTGVHTFYTLDGATRLHEALEAFDGGRLVVNVVDMPIKCPVAPLEFCFLADWYFHERGIRDQVAAHLRDAARRRLHQAGRRRDARRHARRARHRAGHRVQHR